MKLAPLALAFFLLPAAAMAQVKAAPQLQNHYVDNMRPCDKSTSGCYTGETFSVVFPDKTVDIEHYENDKFTLDTFMSHTDTSFGAVLVITKLNGDITADDIAEAYAGMNDAYSVAAKVSDGYVCNANQEEVTQGSFTCQTFVGNFTDVPDNFLTGFTVLRDKKTLVIAFIDTVDPSDMRAQAKFLESFKILLPETM